MKEISIKRDYVEDPCVISVIRVDCPANTMDSVIAEVREFLDLEPKDDLVFDVAIGIQAEAYLKSAYSNGQRIKKFEKMAHALASKARDAVVNMPPLDNLEPFAVGICCTDDDDPGFLTHWASFLRGESAVVDEILDLLNAEPDDGLFVYFVIYTDGKDHGPPLQVQDCTLTKISNLIKAGTAEHVPAEEDEDRIVEREDMPRGLLERLEPYVMQVIDYDFEKLEREIAIKQASEARHERDNQQRSLGTDSIDEIE